MGIKTAQMQGKDNMNDNHLRSQILPETEQFSNSETLSAFEDKMDMSYKKPASRPAGYGAPPPAPHSPLALTHGGGGGQQQMEHAAAASNRQLYDHHGYPHHVLGDPAAAGAAGARSDNGSMPQHLLHGSTMPHSDHMYQMRTQGHDKNPSMGQGGMPRYDGPEMQQAPSNGARYDYASSHNAAGRYEQRIGGRPQQHPMSQQHAAYNSGYWAADDSESIPPTTLPQKLPVAGPVVGRLYHQQLYNKGKKIIERMGTPAPPRNKDNNNPFSPPAENDALNASATSLSTPHDQDRGSSLGQPHGESSYSKNDAPNSPATMTTPAPPTTPHSELFLPPTSNASSHGGSVAEYGGSRAHDDKCNDADADADAGTPPPPTHGSSSTRSLNDLNRRHDPTSGGAFSVFSQLPPCPSNADEIPSISIYSIEEAMLGRGGGDEAGELTASKALVSTSSPRRSATAGQQLSADVYGEESSSTTITSPPGFLSSSTSSSSSSPSSPHSTPNHGHEESSLTEPAPGISLDHTRFLHVPRNNPHPRVNRTHPPGAAAAPKKATTCPSFPLTTSTSSSPSSPSLPMPAAAAAVSVVSSTLSDVPSPAAQSDAASEEPISSESTESTDANTDADFPKTLDVVYGGADEDSALAHLLADDDDEDDYGGSDFKSIASECESDASGDEILFGVSRPM